MKRITIPASLLIFSLIIVQFFVVSPTNDVLACGSSHQNVSGDYTGDCNPCEEGSFWDEILGCHENTPPVITIVGDNPLNLNVGDTFIDPGATADDAEDGDLTPEITSTSTVNTSLVGTYEVAYYVEDSGGLSDSASREVIVSPEEDHYGSIRICKIVKDSEGNIVTDGSSENLPEGAFSVSLLPDTTTSPSIAVFSVNTASFSPNTQLLNENDAYCKTYSDLSLGSYYYTEENIEGDWFTPKYNDQFTVPFDSIEDVFEYSPELWNEDPSDDGNRNQNADGNIVISEGRPNRTLVIVNTYEADEPENTPPVITLIGDNPFNLPLGTEFVEPGATADDAEDGDITGNIATSTNLDINTVGIYEMVYDVTDSGGLSDTATRTISVYEETINTPPVIALLGDNPLDIILGSNLIDPGATADDAEDGDLTSEITSTSTVNTNVLGTYSITYYVEDSGGLSDSAERIVNVVEVDFCELIDGVTGWFGIYYDYPRSHPDMNLPQEDWGLEYGDPLSASESWTTDWYNNEYYEFAQVDPNLEFGSDFFPMDHIVPDEGYVYDHNFYFGIHWRARVTVPVGGDYEYYLTSDDDSWVYVDGELVVDNSGVHSASEQLGGNIHMTDTHIVEVFFAERHEIQSNLNFKFIDGSLIIEPYYPECEEPEPELPILSLDADPSVILLGATSTLTWDSQNADSCEADWTTSTSTSGFEIVSPVITSEYVMTCSNTDGSTSATTTITVNDSPEDPVPSATLVADPDAINEGGTSTLNWSSQNVLSCSADWTTSTSTSGTQDVTPDSTTDYSITCTGDYGDVTATATVTVNPDIPPPSPPSGGGGGFSGSRRHTGEILGAATCSYLEDHLKIDWDNDPVEVLKLQSFLNVFEGENLPLTGVFGPETFAAVERFQIKYSGDILEPWGEKVTTGFVYILTKKKINEIYCNTLYSVSQAEQDEIDAFRAAGGVGGSDLMGVSYPTTEGGIVQLQDQGQVISISGFEEDVSPDIPVIDLATEDSEGTTSELTSTSSSVARNLAVSLAAVPEKIFTSWKNTIIFLVLLAIVIAVIKLFTGGPKDPTGSSSTVVPPVAKTEKDQKDKKDSKKDKKEKNSSKSKEPPVIVLPGMEEEDKPSENLPDEEIVVENPEEEEIDVPDLRDLSDKK